MHTSFVVNFEECLTLNIFKQCGLIEARRSYVSLLFVWGCSFFLFPSFELTFAMYSSVYCLHIIPTCGSPITFHQQLCFAILQTALCLPCVQNNTMITTVTVMIRPMTGVLPCRYVTRNEWLVHFLQKKTR